MNGFRPDDFRVGDWCVAPSIDEISRAGVTTKLEPRTMRVLVCLAERAGDVVSVEELLDAVWKDVVVTPESVYQSIAALRRALGDDPKQPAYIANVVRKGYRLVAPVSKEARGAGEPAPPAPAEIKAPDRKRLVAWIAVTVVAAGAVIGLSTIGRDGVEGDLSSARPTLPGRTIAVLPFADMSERKDQDYFADGMAEEILDMLARIRELKVIARTSSFQFKGRNVDLREVGTKLGADYVVQGGVRKVESKIRVTAQLIDVRSGTLLWVGTYDREFGDVLNVQDEISSNVARALQIVVVSDGTRPMQLRSPEAYTFYLRGRAALDLGNEAGLREAAVLFEQTLALEPDFARAAELLALSHLGLLGNAAVPVDVAWPKAADAARNALRLDPKSALAHAILGLQFATYHYDWAAAARELDLALALKPRDSIALYNLSWLAFDLGRHEEAVGLSEASLSLDPLNPDSCQNSAYIYYLMGKFDAAERNARRSMAISSSFTGNRKLLGHIMLQRGQAEQALVEMRKETSSGKDIGLALALHSLGRHAESDAALARAERGTGRLVPVDMAALHAWRGEKDRAFEWLDRAVAAKDLALGHKFRDEPKLESLRGDPRYQALLAKMNLPHRAVGVSDAR